MHPQDLEWCRGFTLLSIPVYIRFWQISLYINGHPIGVECHLPGF